MNNFRTSQRIRLLGLMAVVTVLGLWAQAALIDNYLVANFQRLEETQVRGNLRLIKLWLDRFLQPLEQQSRRYADLPETARALRGDGAALTARLEATVAEAPLDLAVLLDQRGEVAFAAQLDRSARRLMPLDDEVQGFLTEQLPAWRAAGADIRSGWIGSAEGLVAAALHPVRGETPAMLLLARRFPVADLQALEDLSGALVFTTPLVDGFRKSGLLGEWRAGGRGDRQLELCNRLSPELNRLPMLLCAKLRDSVYLRGMASVDDLRFVTMIGFVALIAAVFLFLDRALLRRLASLHRQLGGARAGNTLDLEQALVEDSRTGDELGQMSGGMGQLLRRVREAEQHMRQQEQSLRELTRSLEFQAAHDDLTKLINRREFGRRLAEALEDCHRNGTSYAVCYVDLDQFKLVNDIAGHHAGDLMLQHIADALLRRIRSSDAVARLGGDEFGLLLAHCNAQQAVIVAEQLRRVIADVRLPWGERSFSVDASVGIAMLDQVEGGVHEALAVADAACFLAKDQGRNRIQMAGRGDLDLQFQMGLMRWAQRLKDALERDRFRLYRQGIHHLKDSRTRPAYELLLRLEDEDGRIVTASEFLEAASRYQMSVGIDRWVFGEALTHIEQECRSGTAARYFVNLSGPSFADESFRSFLITRIAENPSVGPHLVIEVTETALVTNLSKAKALIQVLNQYGVAFALDDFGTGVSSFAYLQELPVQYLKIAGRFVRRMCDNPLDESVVRTFASFGRMQGIETIAEWVEDARTAEALVALGVNHAQGYYYDRPAPLVATIVAAMPAVA